MKIVDIGNYICYNVVYVKNHIPHYIFIKEFKKKMMYKTLLTEEEIKYHVYKTAEKIVFDLKNNHINELTIMPIMNGSIFYAIDLMRQMTKIIDKYNISCKLQIETIRIKSYENNTNIGTTLTCKDIDLIDVTNKNILIVDDVFDTGNTFKWLVHELENRGANLILSTVFIDKTCNHDKQYIPDYISYVLTENKYLVGYGMDDNGYYREWTDLCYISSN